ncbi:hypothetical protein ADICYQ_0293 [Cyclobacterium qasimii M12-11B]|uniref:Uncharacterized protein n=1 Tax=Cyclobacterium qasimii M12-11B TaxID=641524 RepID=S7WXH4_9BACT|nr:hypothetical protein ADICYQ_0293 [Cyclobacterium qasimii M12-11B]
MERIKAFELSREYLEALKENITGEHIASIQESMQDANKADVAALLDELDMMEALLF